MCASRLTVFEVCHRATARLPWSLATQAVSLDATNHQVIRTNSEVNVSCGAPKRWEKGVESLRPKLTTEDTRGRESHTSSTSELAAATYICT